MKRALSLILLTVILLTACGRVAYLEENFFSMDTFMYVKIGDGASQDIRDVKEIIYDIEKTYGKNIEGSFVRDFNLSEGGISASPETAEFIAFALDIADKTDGAFDPTLGALTDKWDEGKRALGVPNASDIDAALTHSGYTKMTRDGLFFGKSNAALKLDLGGIAKGYAADKAIEALKASGIENAMLNLGGNIAVIGESENNKGHGLWSIGIKSPFDENELIGILNVTDRFISVSGAYERYYEADGKRYHHILDPKTGFPSESGIASTVVVSKDGTLSDALSTALFVMGEDKAKAFYESGAYDFEMILIPEDGGIFVSSGLIDSFVKTE